MKQLDCNIMTISEEATETSRFIIFDLNEEPFLTGESITVHLSKDPTSTPTSLTVSGTATFDEAYAGFILDTPIILAELGTLTVGDIVYVYVSYQSDNLNNVAITHPNPVILRVSPPFYLLDPYLSFNDPSEATNFLLGKATCEVPLETVTVVITIDSTIESGTDKVVINDVNPHYPGGWGSTVIIPEGALITLGSIEFNTLLYVWISESNNEDDLRDTPLLLRVMKQADFQLPYSTVAAGISKLSKLVLSCALGTWDDTIKLKITKDEPTPSNQDAVTTAPKTDESEWTATNFDMTPLGTLSHGDTLFLYVAASTTAEYDNKYFHMDVINMGDTSFTISPIYIRHDQLHSLPQLVFAPKVNVNWPTSETTARFSFTNRQGTTKTAPAPMDNDDDKFFVAETTDISTLNVPAADIPATINVEVSNTDGMWYFTHVATLTVGPAFTISPDTLNKNQLTKTPTITIEGEQDSWEETLAAKFIYGSNKVDATVTTTGNQGSRTITIASGKDLTPLGITQFPATVELHLALDGTNFLDYYAPITVNAPGAPPSSFAVSPNVITPDELSTTLPFLTFTEGDSGAFDPQDSGPKARFSLPTLANAAGGPVDLALTKKKTGNVWSYSIDEADISSLVTDPLPAKILVAIANDDSDFSTFTAEIAVRSIKPPASFTLSPGTITAAQLKDKLPKLTFTEGAAGDFNPTDNGPKVMFALPSAASSTTAVSNDTPAPVILTLAKVKEGTAWVYSIDEADISALSSDTPPAKILVAVSNDGEQFGTFTADLTVEGGGGDSTFGIAPLMKMLVTVAVLFFALY